MVLGAVAIHPGQDQMIEKFQRYPPCGKWQIAYHAVPAFRHAMLRIYLDHIP